VSLVARHLEASGIPTVIMGCARDIVEHCGVPRFLFSDFPLVDAAFWVSLCDLVLVAVRGGLARTGDARFADTAEALQRWRDDASWKLDYSNLSTMTPEEIAEKRREFDVVKAVAKSKRDDA